MTTTTQSKHQQIDLRQNKLFHFLIVFLIILAVSIIFHTTDQHCDAGGYYGFSLTFKEIGLFRFDLFTETFRGYFFPWFIAIMNFGEVFGMHGFYITLPLFFSLIFSIILPGIFEYAFSKKVKLYQKIIVTCLFLFLYKGLLIYTLSDFYALAFCLIAIYFVCKVRKVSHFAYHSLLYWVLAGGSSYFAYNTRTIYIIFIILMLVFLIIEGIAHHRKQFFLEIAAFIVGFLICSIPQIIINKTSLNLLSPFVITNYNGDSLFLFQLQAGIRLKKYETYIGHTLADLQGVSFYDYGELFDLTAYTMKDYVSIAIAHPFLFIKLLFVHLFNMIDVRYPNVYIQDFVNTTFVQAINYFAISVSIASIVQKLRDKTEHFSKLLYQSRFILLLLLSSLFIVPGAVETRFGLPVILVLWFFGIYNIRLPKKEDSKMTILIFVIIFIITFIALFAASTQTVYPTLSNLELYR